MTSKNAPAGYETRAYDGPIFKRGDIIAFDTPQGTISGRVKRVVRLRGYYDPTVIVERYLAVDGWGLLVPSSQCVPAGAR